MPRMGSERLYFVGGHCGLATFAWKVMSTNEKGSLCLEKTRPCEATPNTGAFCFGKGQLFEDTKLSIYDLQGRLIKSIVLSANETTHRIDVSSFNTGVYMVSLKNSSQEKTEKVVIK